MTRTTFLLKPNIRPPVILAGSAGIIFLIFIVIGFVKNNYKAGTGVGQEQKIITVTGSIDSAEMGVTLVHEHVMVDWIGADSSGYHRWEQEEVLEWILPFFEKIGEKGVDTVVDCTPSYLGRDPFILEELSRRTGIQILTNTGYYGATNNAYIPEHAYRENAEEIASRWIDEFTNGIDSSGVRPGFMKISVSGDPPFSRLHQNIVRSAAFTHLETGMVIASHTNGDKTALEQIRILKAEGVSPSAWIWTHAQSGSLNGNLQVAEEGAWISLDGVNHDPSRKPGERGTVDWYAHRIVELKNAGFLNSILISHDGGWYDVGEPNEENFRSYTDIFDHLIHRLKKNGFTQEEIQQLLVTNPRQAYGIQVRRI